MNKSSNIIRTMCEIGLFAAVGFILDELQGALAVSFPNGGSIGLAMVAVLIVAYRRGYLPAIFTGLIIGTLDLLTKVYIYHPIQVFLDYILPYAFVGLAGFFKPLFDKAKERKEGIKWLLLGTIVGGMAKFISHYLSGVIFFNDPSLFAWGLNNMNGFLYSAIYNFAFIGPSIILCGAAIVLIYVKAPVILKVKQYEQAVEKIDSEKQNKPVYSWGTTIIYLVGGLTAFIWFLIDYIKFIEIKDKESYIKFSSNRDSVLICVLALLLIIAGSISLYKLIKKKNPDTLLAIVFVVDTGLLTLYSIANIISLAVEDKAFVDYKMYVYWMIIAFLLCVLGIIGLANHIKMKKGEEI